MEIVLTILAVLVVLVAGELWWRRHEIHDEFSRKFVHITVGSFVASWPFFLEWYQITLLSIAFLLAVLVSKYLKLFEAIHSVQRPTWGEIFFAAAVGAIALITEDKWIYAASVLQMSLADGLAAVVGVRFGGRFRYSVLGHTKSAIGTATFFVVSLIILVLLNQHFPHPLSAVVLIALSAAASLLENLAVTGLDNLLVPLLVALVLVNS